MEKNMKNEKIVILEVKYYLKENIKMIKEMGKEKNIIPKVI